MSNSCDPMDCSPPGSSVQGFPRQEYWSGLPFPFPGDLADPGIKSEFPVLQADSLPGPPGKPCVKGLHSKYLGIITWYYEIWTHVHFHCHTSSPYLERCCWPQLTEGRGSYTWGPPALANGLSLLCRLWLGLHILCSPFPRHDSELFLPTARLLNERQ